MFYLRVSRVFPRLVQVCVSWAQGQVSSTRFAAGAENKVPSSLWPEHPETDLGAESAPRTPVKVKPLVV